MSLYIVLFIFLLPTYIWLSKHISFGKKIKCNNRSQYATTQNNYIYFQNKMPIKRDVVTHVENENHYREFLPYWFSTLLSDFLKN